MRVTYIYIFVNSNSYTNSRKSCNTVPLVIFKLFQPKVMEGKFLKEASDATISIIFSLDEKVGALAEGLKIFKVMEPMSGTMMTPPSP
jgi:hypothetical protein